MADIVSYVLEFQVAKTQEYSHVEEEPNMEWEILAKIKKSQQVHFHECALPGIQKCSVRKDMLYTFSFLHFSEKL